MIIQIGAGMWKMVKDHTIVARRKKRREEDERRCKKIRGAVRVR